VRQNVGLLIVIGCMLGAVVALQAVPR